MSALNWLCFEGYAENSILYNRGVYPEETFERVKKYGPPLLLSQDEGVKTFIANLHNWLSEWLEAGKLQRIVLVIMSKATNEVLERWNFSIETDNEVVGKGVSREKSDKDVTVPFTRTESDLKLIAYWFISGMASKRRLFLYNHVRRYPFQLFLFYYICVQHLTILPLYFWCDCWNVLP